MQHDIVFEITVRRHFVVIHVNRILATNHLNVFLIRIRKQPANNADKERESILRVNDMLANCSHGSHNIYAELLEGRKLHKAIFSLIAFGDQIEDKSLGRTKSFSADVHGAAFLNSHAPVRIYLNSQILVFEHQVQKVARTNDVVGIHSLFYKHWRKRRSTTLRRTVSKY